MKLFNYLARLLMYACLTALGGIVFLAIIILHIKLMHAGILYSFHASDAHSAMVWIEIECVLFILYLCLSNMYRMYHKMIRLETVLTEVIVI